MRRILIAAISFALLAPGFGVGVGAPAAAEGIDASHGGIDASHGNARTVRRPRTGPELSDLDADDPDEYETSWDEYNRERAEYYRDKRQQEQRKHRTGGTGACMYGADGSVIYAPAGRQCGPAAPGQ
jgi:hypothetical protein